MGVAEELIERGRAGAPAGECAQQLDGGVLHVALLLRPAVPMSHYMGIRAVCALGALDWARGCCDAPVLAWPGDVVVAGEDGRAVATVCAIEAHAATGDAGMFAVCSADVSLAALSGAGAVPAAVAEGLCSAICARVDAWAATVAAGHGIAGPVAAVLSDYFDTIALMGHDVEVVYPNGRVAATGTLTAVDVWGRATVRLSDGRELVISPEQASLR